MLDRRQFIASCVAAAPALLFTGRPAHAGAGPLALVTADREAHVAVVSLAGMRVIQRLRTLEDPRAIQRAAGGRAVLAHSAAGAVSLLAGRPLRVRRVLRGFGTPRYTVTRSAPPWLAYVSDSASGEIAVVDLDAGRVLRRVAVGEGARHLALRPDGATLWVALGSSAAQIAVLDLRDPERPRLRGHVRPPFLAHDVAFSPSGRRVWVTAGRASRVAIFAAGSRDLVRELAADAAPQHVAFGAGVAYIASGDAGTLCVHALSDGRLRRRSRVPAGSYNLEHASARVVTPSLGTGALTVLDARGVVVARTRAAIAAHDVCLLS